MEFKIKKCGMFVLKRRQLMQFEGVEMPNCETIKEIEKKWMSVSRYFSILAKTEKARRRITFGENI